MLTFIAYFTVCAILAHAQEEEMIEFDNKTECINQMVEWCDGMQYPQQGVGLALMSVTFEDPKGYYRIFCSSDSEGTNCTRNGISWFACSPQHVMTYKGRVMTNTSTDVDNDICATANTAFNDIFIQNLSYDNTTMKTEVTKGFEAFFEQMTAMEEQIELIQKLLRTIPAINNLWSEFDDSFLFENPDSTTSARELIQRSDMTTFASGSSDLKTNIADISEETDSITTVPSGSETSYSTTTVPGGTETSDSTTTVPGGTEISDSTTTVLVDLDNLDSTTAVADSFQGSDSTTTGPVDNQNSSQQSNQVEKE